MNFLIVLLLQLSVEPPTKAFAQAEVLYQKGSFGEAARVYEEVSALGFEDAVVYYNLGNAYFKAGHLGRAVLNYERALVLMPRDDDIIANLAYANQLVTGSVEPLSLPLVVRWVVAFYRYLDLNALAKILSVLFVVGGVAFYMVLDERWFSLRKHASVVVVVGSVLILAGGVTLIFKLLETSSAHVGAIVLKENAYVRSGPNQENPRLVEIHEGLKVVILNEREDWYQISLENGLVGWLKTSEVEPI